MAKFEISIGENGFGKVFLDGSDITNGLKSVDVHCEALKVPEVVLTFFSTATKIKLEKTDIIVNKEE